MHFSFVHSSTRQSSSKSSAVGRAEGALAVDMGGLPLLSLGWGFRGELQESCAHLWGWSGSLGLGSFCRCIGGHPWPRPRCSHPYNGGAGPDDPPPFTLGRHCFHLQSGRGGLALGSGMPSSSDSAPVPLPPPREGADRRAAWTGVGSAGAPGRLEGLLHASPTLALQSAAGRTSTLCTAQPTWTAW